MNSRITMGLAGLLLAGAIFVVYWGLVLSHQPVLVAEPMIQSAAPVALEKAVATAEDQPCQPVVVLVHDVPPFVPISAADLALEKLRSAPAGSLSSIDQVVGRAPWRHLSAGAWFSDDSFEAGGPQALSWAGESDSPANLYAVDSHLFKFTQLALGAASKGLARNNTVATLHTAIEIIRGNQAS